MADVPGHVKSRPYDTRGRQAQSARTRQRILEAGRDLILAQGYRATTIGSIAVRAGVNVDTVYQLIGRKPVLLRELIEQAISGADRPVPAEERDYVQAIRSESDPAAKLRIYAGAVRRIQERLAPLFMALREAAVTEPEAHAVWQHLAERRADNMRTFIQDVHTAGGLRPGLSIEQAADMVWAMASSEMYTLLTVERRWSPEQFERWLVDQWCRGLLTMTHGQHAGTG